jgi:hypothetical protein
MSPWVALPGNEEEEDQDDDLWRAAWKRKPSDPNSAAHDIHLGRRVRSMTTPLQIFNHQQSLVSRSVVVVNRHQEACALLLASLPNPRPESAFPRTIDCSVAWNTGYLLEAAAPHLQIAASPESRVFVALASVVDEIHSLARWLQDYAFAWLTADAKSLDLLVDASRAGKRMCLLVRNLVAQLEGLQRVKPSGFKPEAVPLWVALARAMQTLASMDALRPSLGLVAEALAQDLVQVSANTRAWGAKALHRLLDACQAPDEALAAAGLYVLLHRLGHTQDQALFGRVWSLQLRLAPVVWIRRRVVLKLDEFLSRFVVGPAFVVCTRGGALRPHSRPRADMHPRRRRA